MNSPQQTAYNNDDEVSLVDLAVLLVKRWKLMLVIFLLVMLAAVAYALTRPASYTFTSLYAMAETVNEEGEFIGLETANAVLTKLDIMVLPRQTQAYLSERDWSNLPFEVKTQHLGGTNLISLSSQADSPQADDIQALHQRILEAIAEEQTALLERKRAGLESRLDDFQNAMRAAGVTSGILAEPANAIETELEGLHAGEIEQVALRSQSEGANIKLIMALAVVLGVMLAIMGAFISHFIAAVRRSLKEK